MSVTESMKKPEQLDGTAKPLPEQKPVNTPSGQKTFGIDVSHYQPNMDWKKVFDMGKRFAIAKATDGNGDSADTMYDRHRAGAKAAGLIFGSYHFYRPTKDPIKQADTFLRVTGGVEAGELPLTLDLEPSNGVEVLGKYADNVLECLKKLEVATGKTPIIYTGYYFFQNILVPENFFRFHPWIAAYNNVGPKIPAPWQRWQFWQYTDHEPIPGTSGVDGDVFNGSLEELKQLVKK